MEQQPVPHKKIIFVCTNQRDEAERPCCAGRGGGVLRDKLKAMIKERKLAASIRVSRSGCLDRCAKGANIMVFPDNVWYSAVTEEDLETILGAVAHSLESHPSQS
jgi:(2Fe-2S) ferredoxin